MFAYGTQESEKHTFYQMRYRFVLLIIFLIPCSCLGQSTVTVQGRILDASNGKPIPYAHIGIPTEHVGTASKQNGTFRLDLNQKYRNDTLQVSAIGYHTKKFSLSSISSFDSVTFRLQPKTYQMKSVTVTDAEPETEWIGKKYAQF